MTAATPPPPRPDDAVVTPGIDNPAPAVAAPDDELAIGGVTASADVTASAGGTAPADATTPGVETSRPRREPVVSTAPIRPVIIVTSVAITVLQLVLTAAGVASEADTVRNIVAVVSVALFFLGAGAFVAAFVLAAGRSRYEELWFGGAFFLTGGVVPARARSMLMGCLVVQSIVGLVGASLAPFTPVAFVVLVPLAAMGLMSLYGARWGEFSPKPEAD